MMHINFSDNNFIKSYQYYAFPLGILSNNKLFYSDWILGKYIQLFYGSNLQFDEQYYTDWDITESIEIGNIIKANPFPLVLRRYILNGYAIHIWNLNERYIPDTYAYNRFDFFHDLLIIGYEKDRIKIVSYNKSRYLSQRNISLNDLTTSFTRDTNARAFKFKLSNCIVDDPKQIITKFKQYINPNKINVLNYYDDKLNPQKEMLVGIYAVRKFIDDIRNNMYGQDHTNSFCVLWEHKNILNLNLEYLCKKKILDQTILMEYKQILESSKLIGHLYLKLMLNPEKRTETCIINKLESLLENDVNILQRLVSDLT